MKNIAVCYHGGCGGHFIFYYLLASNSFSHKNKYTNSILKEKHIKDQFYFQFKNTGNWVDKEVWPENQYQEKNQVFHCCGYIPEKSVECIKICPYIENTRDWFRTILFKKTTWFRKKKISSINTVKKVYKEFLHSPPNLKIENCDYYFNLIEFVQNNEEQEKLCKFLGIKMNNTMKEFIKHYQKLHINLKKTNWVKKNIIDK